MESEGMLFVIAALIPFHSLPLYSLSFSQEKKMEQELDLQNPHYDDVSSLFANESDHMSLLLSFDPSDSRFSIRRTALSLIFQAKFSYGLDPFLVYLSVNYVDRFLSKQELLDKSPWIPHILFVASLSLAAKMRNSDSSILLAVLQREGGYEFEAQSVHRMEKIILAALQWRMRSITPFSFLQYFISLLKQDSSLTQSLTARASDIIYNVQHELKLLEFKPSMIAASALLCAIQDLNPPTFSSSEITLSSCEHVSKEGGLMECVGMIREASSSGTSTPTSVLEEAAVSDKKSVKRRRLNGLCDNRTFQISQIQHCL
ncbi:putative cyclin-D6-1 [Salvia hispanica]|uniref:putative cyclin-D6-1 n=1 Tax=Salvia hispanica TaxID=49212 RepID=UPI002009A6C9|nr:putative cyclin-D6-1 [Salvia hispanica]